MADAQAEEGAALNDGIQLAGTSVHEDGKRRSVGASIVEEVGRRASVGGGGIVFHTHHAPQGALDEDDVKEPLEAISLPQSTHTLLFTEDVLSLPFVFAFAIFGLSIGCLVLALYDNLDHTSADNPLNVPANVSGSVRVAQFFSLVVAVLTEEEIPTALYLLRTIPRSSLRSKLGFSYTKFVASAMCRLAIGYLFLLNVYLVLVQASGVLDMFYDMLALNFVSMIDDIAFRLCALDILGKRLRSATSATCFRTEFERKPYIFRRKMTIFTKFVFAFNFLTLFGGILAIAALQRRGHFQCASITVNFGDEIWEHAWVTHSGLEDESMVLVYSYFNGLYKMNGTYAGRPVYREMRKSGDEHFGGGVIGAVIMYCEEEEAWIFTHEKIRKTQALKESSCPWLLRSENTDAYDLLDVSNDWEIWVGVIESEAKLSITCNECQSDTDCNLNGVCTDDKTCKCTNPAYEGRHCELETPCPQIFNELTNETWAAAVDVNCEEYAREYARPVYTRLSRGPLSADAPIDVGYDDRVSLIYSGSRWLGVRLEGGLTLSSEELEGISSSFHAFWNKIYDNGTLTVSDPTKGSTPVGADFYIIGERGPQYGPFGVLYPFRSPPGRGLFRCAENVTKADHLEFCKAWWDENLNLGTFLMNNSSG